MTLVLLRGSVVVQQALHKNAQSLEYAFDPGAIVEVWIDEQRAHPKILLVLAAELELQALSVVEI